MINSLEGAEGGRGGLDSESETREGSGGGGDDDENEEQEIKAM